MKRLYILLALLIALMSIGEVSAQRSRITKTRNHQRTHRVVKKHRKSKGKKIRTAKLKRGKKAVVVDPRLNDPNYNPYLRDRIDERYEKNIDLAHRYGLKVGSYHFFRPKSPLHLQLQNFMTQCRPGEQDLIPMIDIETTGGLPTDVFCDSLITFLAMVEKAYRQQPLIYTYRNFYNKHLLGKLDDYKLMIAMYTPEEPVLDDRRDITMWQYTSKGRIVGVSGYVDKSRFMGKHGLRDIRFRHIHPVKR